MADVSLDVLVLGLASVIRPTSMAAVYAFLSARSPTRLLVAYLAAGLTLSLGVGIAAVAVVHVNPPPATVTGVGRAVLDVVLGVAALGTALYLRLRPPREIPAEPPPERPPSALRRRLKDPTVSSAAVAGVVTHLPGVFYLGALAAIVAGGPGLVEGLLQVGLYNLLWYAVPLAALVSWTRHPETTRDAAARLTAWIQRNKSMLTVGIVAVAGVYLLAVGIYDLVTR